MAKKKQRKWNEGSAIRGALRRIFSRSPVIRDVLQRHRRSMPRINQDGNRSKRDAVQYQCMVCNLWVSSTDIAVDHIDPVISVEDGFQDWNVFVQRLFCDASNLQTVCSTCHQEKTNRERKARKLASQKK